MSASVENARRHGHAVALRRLDELHDRQTEPRQRGSHRVDMRRERGVAILEVRVGRVKRRVADFGLRLCQRTREVGDDLRLIH